MILIVRQQLSLTTRQGGPPAFITVSPAPGGLVYHLPHGGSVLRPHAFTRISRVIVIYVSALGMFGLFIFFTVAGPDDMPISWLTLITPVALVIVVPAAAAQTWRVAKLAEGQPMRTTFGPDRLYIDTPLNSASWLYADVRRLKEVNQVVRVTSLRTFSLPLELLPPQEWRRFSYARC
ncbi:MAG: hypothetical protein L0G99_09525 [Propionibacteriales bacterium]|nr:hypothetical protein [Propionibacteriales bacterium]